MGRAIVAVICGIVSAFVVILVVEVVGQVLVPVAGSPPLTDTAAMRDYLATLPLAAYAFVLAAYFAGGVAGGHVAARIAPARKRACVWIVGALLLATTIANMTRIMHPTWVVIASIAIVLFATWLATMIPVRPIDVSNTL